MPEPDVVVFGRCVPLDLLYPYISPLILDIKGEFLPNKTGDKCDKQILVLLDSISTWIMSSFQSLKWFAGVASIVSPQFPGIAKFYMFLTPFLALLLGYAVTGGLPDKLALAGGGIVLAALALFTLAGRKSGKSPAALKAR